MQDIGRLAKCNDDQHHFYQYTQFQNYTSYTCVSPSSLSLSPPSPSSPSSPSHYLDSFNGGAYFIGTSLDYVCVATMGRGHATLVEILEQDLPLL